MRFSTISCVYEVCSENNFYYILRNNLTNDSFFLKEKEFQLLMEDIKSSTESPDVKKLKNSHIIVPDDYSESKFLKCAKDKYFLKKPDVNMFYLTFNNECNLACKYCYVEGSYDENKKSISMSEDVFEDTMDFLEGFIGGLNEKEELNPKLSFIYYGSEPLLNPDYVKRSIEKIDEICKKVGVERDINIITNATLINEDLVKFFKKYDVELAISLDGPKEINDEMRIFKSNKKGTYDKIIESIKLLKRHGVTFGISCTIGPHNVDLLKENIDSFKSLGAGGVGFNTLLSAKNTEIPFLSINKSNDKLITASDYANKNALYEDRVQRKVKAFNKKEYPHFKDCGAVGNQLVFYPDGKIGVCQAYLGCNGPSIGNVTKNKNNPLLVLESDALKNWNDRMPINMPECRDCPALGVCGGGCVFNAEVKYGDINCRDKNFCVHTYKILDWLLEKSVREKLKTEDVYIKDISFMHR